MAQSHLSPGSRSGLSVKIVSAKLFSAQYVCSVRYVFQYFPISGTNVVSFHQCDDDQSQHLAQLSL